MKKLLLGVTAAALLVCTSTQSWANEDKSNTPEMRKHLAEMYQKMGECLAKTDKSIQDCQVDVMKGCPVAEKLGYCPIEDGIKAMNSKRSQTTHPKK